MTLETKEQYRKFIHDQLAGVSYVYETEHDAPVKVEINTQTLLGAIENEEFRARLQRWFDETSALDVMFHDKYDCYDGL